MHQQTPAEIPIVVIGKESASAHYGTLAAQAQDEARERQALTDALAEANGFLNIASGHFTATTVGPEGAAIDALIQALKYLRTAVDLLSERVQRLEGGTR